MPYLVLISYLSFQWTIAQCGFKPPTLEHAVGVCPAVTSCLGQTEGLPMNVLKTVLLHAADELTVWEFKQIKPSVKGGGGVQARQCVMC